MKKSKSTFFVIILSTILLACANPDNFAVESFKGTIIESHGESALVLIDEGEPVRKSGSEVSVNLSINEEVTFKVGDRVEVWYDGVVGESFPLSINTIDVKHFEGK